MAKDRSPIYNWDKENGIASCSFSGTLRGHKKMYTGWAHVHPEDEDMSSELVGTTLAEWRAHIEMLQDYKDNEIEPALAALKQLYYSMNRSKHFNPKSYEAKMLFRQIRLKEEDLAFCKNAIQKTKRFIKEYIDQKEQNYQLIRKKRKQK